MEDRKVIISLAAITLLLIGVAVWLLMPKAEEPEPTPAKRPTAVVVPTVVEPDEPQNLEEVVVQEPEPEPEIELPIAPDIVYPPLSLNDSDGTVQAAATKMAARLVTWLQPTEQIRKWVVFVDVAADGDLMGNHRPWDLDIGAFKTYGDEGEESLSQANFERYNTIVSTVESIPVETLAYYFDRWEPLFNEAYAELGKPGRFKQRLLMALDQVLVAEQLDELPKLARPSVMFTYEDVNLESATAVQKLMWRMGPENAAKLQLYASALREELVASREYQIAE